MSTNNCRRVSFEKWLVVGCWQWEQESMGAMRTIEIQNFQMND